MSIRSVVGLALAIPLALGHQHHVRSDPNALSQAHLSINGIPHSTRAHWMRKANEALMDVHGDPCPFGAFGTAIVNHTVPGLGELVCIGANSNRQTGDPIMHGKASQLSLETSCGEMSAIQNCSQILTSPSGPYNLTPTAALAAFSQLSLYTNAESCPMCASAIRWAGFKEYIYGTSIDTLIEKGWGQIRISSMEVFRESFDLGGATRLVGEVLTNETDIYFGWQYDPQAGCPEGCGRVEGSCKAVEE
ncbi:hypothetical protein N0V90_006958 [Kalmusia sp. IMI 367209]|nr:hypothetical protein N0V90_006958 [Kalmusia sp. IMI 367209]